MQKYSFNIHSQCAQHYVAKMSFSYSRSMDCNLIQSVQTKISKQLLKCQQLNLSSTVYYQINTTDSPISLSSSYLEHSNVSVLLKLLLS